MRMSDMELVSMIEGEAKYKGRTPKASSFCR